MYLAFLLLYLSSMFRKKSQFILSAVITVMSTFWASNSFAQSRQDKITAAFISNHSQCMSTLEALDYIDFFNHLIKTLEIGPATQSEKTDYIISLVEERFFLDHPSRYRMCLKSKALKSRVMLSSDTYEIWSDKQIGIIGDSVATGAVADPRISGNTVKLFGKALSILADLFSGVGASDTRGDSKIYSSAKEFGISENAPSFLSRIFYAYNELEDDKITLEQRGAAIASQKLDLEEYSFGYMVGRALNYMPQDILLAGQDGTRISSLRQQLRRLLVASGKNLPEKIIVSYNANDMCTESIFTDNLEQIYLDYYNTYKEELLGIKGEFTASADKTKVYILAPLDVTQVLTSKSILSKQVELNDSPQTSCKNLRRAMVGDKQVMGLTGIDLAEAFDFDLIEALSGMCASVQKTKLNDGQRIYRLQTVYNKILKAQEQAVLDASAQMPSDIELIYVPETVKIQFTAEDVANDCFHPSVYGQEKIARTVLKVINKEN